MANLLKRFKRKEVLIILLCAVLIFGQVWLDLKLPDYMVEITKLVQTEGSKLVDILIQGGWMLLCAFGSLALGVITGYASAYVSSTFTLRIRKLLFDKVESFSMEEIKKFSTSSLITRTTNDITNIQMLISFGMVLLIKAPITAAWAIFKILNKSWQWTAITGASLVIVILYILLIVLLVLPKFKKIQGQIDELNNVTRENLSGIRVVRAFNADSYQETKFEKANNELTKTQQFNNAATSTISPFLYIIMYILNLAIFFVGAYLINDATMSSRLDLFSNMIVFSVYAMQVLMAFVMLGMIFIILPRSEVSAKRVAEVLNTEIKIKDGTKKDGKEVGTVEFKDVCFKYPDGKDYAVKNISFKVNKGEIVAFIGSTGSGKTTLINLIPRFYDVNKGEVLVDGVNVKEYKSDSLHNKLGYIPQKAGLFSGTVKDNITYGEKYGKDPTEEEIKEAARVAQASDFIEALEGGYDAHIAQGGSNISGGQKQRLSIARAIARKPEIYIFDDTFSALDYKTDSKLRSELKKYTKDSTNIIVTQRIGTVMNADKIIVSDEGIIVGMGTHKELLKKCEVYKEIAYSQLSKEELNNE